MSRPDSSNKTHLISHACFLLLFAKAEIKTDLVFKCKKKKGEEIKNTPAWQVLKHIERGLKVCTGLNIFVNFHETMEPPPCSRFGGSCSFGDAGDPPLAMSEHQMCTHKSSPKYQRTVIGTGDFAHLVLMQKCVKLPGRECVYSPSESRSIRASIRPQTPARVVQTCQSRSAFLQKPKHLKNMTIF